MDVELLSRIQFALTAGFHFLFPPISIGLALYIVFIEAAWLKTGGIEYQAAAKFFLKLFAVIFAVGVVTGIVLEFEFGTNWPVYSNFVGDVFGSPLAIEAVFAFFMESVFLGIAVWGWNKIGKKAHFFATVMMCVGTHLSAVWILAANSFMQTPAGFELQYTDPATKIAAVLPNGTVPSPEQIEHTRAAVVNFWEMALSASMPDRFFHTVAGAWLTGAFFALGVCGYLILRGKGGFARPCAKLALWFAAASSAFMLLTGHSSARLLAFVQPEKLAAFEAQYETVETAPLCLFGVVDENAKNVAGVKIYGLLSLLTYGSLDGEIKGLNDLPSDEFLRKVHPNADVSEFAKIRPQYWPPVSFCFQTFRFMVYLGCAMIAYVAWGAWLAFRKKLFDLNLRGTRLFWILSLPSVLMPLAASQLGWASAEVGRQPWIVWRVLKTSDAVTTSASAGEILFSIILFSAIFIAVAAVAIMVLFKKIKSEAE